MTVEVGLPYDGCQGNNPRHWRVRDTARRLYRNECKLAYLTAIRTGKMRPIQGQCRITLEYFTARGKVPDGRYRPHDDANGIDAFRSGQDALVDAGIITDDTRKYVRQGPCTIYGKKKEHGGRACVIVTLEEIRND